MFSLLPSGTCGKEQRRQGQTPQLRTSTPLITQFNKRLADGLTASWVSVIYAHPEFRVLTKKGYRLKNFPIHSRVVVFKKRERERILSLLNFEQGPTIKFCLLACLLVFTRNSTLTLHLMKHEMRERILSATRHFPHFMNPETTWKRNQKESYQNTY